MGLNQSRVATLVCITAVMLALSPGVKAPSPESRARLYEQNFFVRCGHMECDSRNQYCHKNLNMCMPCKDDCSREVLDNFRPKSDQAVEIERCHRICQTYMALQSPTQATTTVPSLPSLPSLSTENPPAIKEAPKPTPENSNAAYGIIFGALCGLFFVCVIVAVIIYMKRKCEKQKLERDGTPPEQIPLRENDSALRRDEEAGHGVTDSQAGQPDDVPAERDETLMKTTAGGRPVAVPEGPEHTEANGTVIALESNHVISQESDQDKDNPPVVSP